MRLRVSHFAAGAAEHWSDAVFAQAHLLANLLIRHAFEVVHPNDLGFLRIEPQHKFTDLIHIVESRILGLRVQISDMIAVEMSRFGVPRGAAQLANDHASRDDGQVCGERAIALEATQGREIVRNDGDEDFRNEILAQRRRKRQATRLSRMVCDMDH